MGIELFLEYSLTFLFASFSDKKKTYSLGKSNPKNEDFVIKINADFVHDEKSSL